jgi:hypothetical protein
VSQSKEIDAYPSAIVRQASRSGVTPSEFVGKGIKAAIARGNPLVREDDQFVVLGIDSFDGHFYPCGSFSSVEDARIKVRKLREDGEQYSPDHMNFDCSWEALEHADTFCVFTNEGTIVPPQDSSSS